MICKQGALAGAGRADNGERFAACDFERDFLEHRQRFAACPARRSAWSRWPVSEVGLAMACHNVGETAGKGQEKLAGSYATGPPRGGAHRPRRLTVAVPEER